MNLSAGTLVKITIKQEIYQSKLGKVKKKQIILFETIFK